ncbi:MAG: TonB-dependent receptor [Pseudomonadota bacterium]
MTRIFSITFLLLLASAALSQQNEKSSEVGEAAPQNPIETVIVTGRASKLYRIGETQTGKLPLAPLEASQSITSIPEALIRDQGAREAGDLYRNISGVTTFSYAGVTARGFRQQDIFYDGLRGDPLVGFAVPQLFNIEQVDFLKGPAGMLYGVGAPGGLFNYVTKRPTEAFEANVRAILGNFDRRGLSGEVSGELPVKGLAGRIGLFHEERDLFQENTGNETGIYDFALSQAFGSTLATLQFTRYDQELPGSRLRGVLVEENGDFISDIEWNHNEPSDGMMLDTDYFNLRLEGSVGTHLSWNSSLRYIDGEETQQWHGPIVVFEDRDPDLIERSYVDQNRDREILSAGANLIWQFDLGAVETRVLAGFDVYEETLNFRNGGANPAFLFGAVPALSISNPQYGLADPSTYDISNTFTDTEQYRAGAYLLGEFSWEQWIATVGVRYDEFEDESDFTNLSGLTSVDTFDDSDTSLRVGLVYQISDEVSVYAQWSESFEPQNAGVQNEETGGPFDPTVGEMYEVGIKTALFGGRLQSSLVAYQIVRENLLQPDPDVFDPRVNRQVPIGEIESQGFEFDVTADITDNWVITVAYAYNDTSIKEDVTGEGDGIPNEIDGQFINAPENQLGIWTRYQLPRWNMAVALGMDAVDDRVGFGGQLVPSYEVFDASLFWEPGPFSVMLRVDNLLDDEFTTSGFFDTTNQIPAVFGPTLGAFNFPGSPRGYFVEVSKSW